MGGNIGNVIATCSKVPSAYQMECANNVGRVISTATKNNTEEIKKDCALFLSVALHEECINAIGQSVFVLGDNALPIEICKMIPSVQGKQSCYQQLMASFVENKLSQSKIALLCAQFEKDYQSLCNAL